MSSWSRRLCAFFFWSGCVVAAASIILYDSLGVLIGYPLWALAWALAALIDRSKWSR